jgi:hypothetical protein
MRLLISSDSDNIDDIFFYCQQHDIPMYYGRLYNDHTLGYFGWQIVVDSTPASLLLLLKYSDSYAVID